jgi:hypothetical protein
VAVGTAAHGGHERKRSWLMRAHARSFSWRQISWQSLVGTTASNGCKHGQGRSVESVGRSSNPPHQGSEAAGSRSGGSCHSLSHSMKSAPALIASW